MEKEVINEICKFIIDKCEVMNIGNFEILSEMIVNDVKSIQSKLHQPTVSVADCVLNNEFNHFMDIDIIGACSKCGSMKKK